LERENTAKLDISKEGIRVIINFFDQYPILGNKALDYAGFREVAIIIERNEHKTKKGLQRCID
jgi:hypothetical protein